MTHIVRCPTCGLKYSSDVCPDCNNSEDRDWKRITEHCKQLQKENK